MPEQTWNLVADIGATNARFALCDDARELHEVGIVPVADFPGIQDALDHYLAKRGRPALRNGVIGIANPVLGDRVQMTNSPWAFSIEETRRTFGMERLSVINDFTALALSLPLLPERERVQVGGREPRHSRPRGVLGPGTGFGVSALIPTPDNAWIPLEGEGGHANFSPASELEAVLWSEARQIYGHVSIERLLSGAGLQFIYRSLSRRDGVVAEELSPADISGRGLEGSCPRCRETLDTFCAILGTAAADLALTLGAGGGIYIGGGIVPKLGAYFAKSPFRARFENKGRFSDYMAQIPVFVISGPYPALYGAAAFLQGPADLGHTARRGSKSVRP